MHRATIIGVDLSADSTKTGIVILRTGAGQANVDVHPLGRGARPDRVSVQDNEIKNLAQGANKVAIDAPFGWPDPFVQAVSEHHDRRGWTTPAHPYGQRGNPLTMRQTDQFVAGPNIPHAVTPLTVSADRIGATAMRCARLQTLIDGPHADRLGGGRLLEVYPAAALAAWNMPRDDYKKRPRWRGAAGRQFLLEQYFGKERWLTLTRTCENECLLSDDYFDALIAALVGLAAQLNRTWPAPSTQAQKKIAAREGWIHVPKCSLAQLGQLL